MKKYQIGLKIYSTQEVEAESKEEARKIIQSMDRAKIISDSELTIDYIERIQENADFFEVEEDE
jgi:hypothetical protein